MVYTSYYSRSLFLNFIEVWNIFKKFFKIDVLRLNILFIQEEIVLLWHRDDTTSRTGNTANKSNANVAKYARRMNSIGK